MVSRVLHRFANRRLLATSAILAGAGAAASANGPSKFSDEADAMFRKSSIYPVPLGWTGRVWEIRNDYPGMPGIHKLTSGAGKEGMEIAKRDIMLPPMPPTTPLPPTIPLPPTMPLPPKDDAPWMNYDFKTQPESYCTVIKDYCWEGNENNEFVVQKNTIRNWYHAAWMHYGETGREPLNGLTYELPTPHGVIAESQKRYIQNWACGYYNEAGATVFGNMWKDTSNPKWGRDISFPKGTCVFKLLFTDATEDEIPILKGAPTMDAVIFTGVNPATGKPTGRNDFASKLRLLQVDFAVKDHRSPIGWIFGSFVYDGSKKHPNPWQRIIPIGLMWGNSPNLTQAAYEAGERPYEQWMNPEATNLMKKLGGSKPMPGWNGRFNGPVDNFISSCISCHSMAQKAGETKMTPDVIQSPPGHYCPVDDKKLMQWFRNIPAGEPFTKDATSGDYSLQLMIGYHRFHHWKNSRLLYERLFVGTKFIFTGEKMPGSLEKREALRESQFTGHNHSKRTSAWRPLRNYNIPLSETYIDRKPLGG